MIIGHLLNVWDERNAYSNFILTLVHNVHVFTLPPINPFSDNVKYNITNYTIKIQCTLNKIMCLYNNSPSTSLYHVRHSYRSSYLFTFNLSFVYLFCVFIMFEWTKIQMIYIIN